MEQCFCMTEKYKSGLSFKLLKNSRKLSQHYDNKNSLYKWRNCLSFKHTQHDYLISHHSKYCLNLEKEITQSLNELICFSCAKAHRTKKSSGFISSSAKTLLHVRCRGSMTVEAAFVVPFIIFFLVLFLGLFQLLAVEIKVNQALSYAASALATEMLMNENEILEGIVGKQILIKELKKQGATDEEFVGGFQSIKMNDRESDGEYVRLTVHYAIRMPLNIFGKDVLEVSQSAAARRWKGRSSGQTGDNRWVYIAPFGTVYHSGVHCSYLDLSLVSVSEQSVGSLRNKDGGRYYKCQGCIMNAENASGKTVYVTDYGTQYHYSLNCSGIKRTIRRVLEKNVVGRTPCQKCY